MLQDEYYIIKRENNNNYPLFAWDQSRKGFGRRKPIIYSELVKMRLSNPIPINVEWVDFHPVPDPVVSKKIINALTPLNLYGVQYIPAKVYDPRNMTKFHYYWLLNVWNRIRCLDLKQSDLEIDSFDGSILGIKKLVLDEEKLNFLELKKRMMFKLEEKMSTLLVHKKVKDAIESVKPKGIRFFKVTEWNSDSCFD